MTNFFVNKGITRSMFKALGARGHLFSLFVISLVKGA